MTASLAMLRAMLRIRRTEERIAELIPEQEIRCPVHLSIGQEASAVGVCAALQSTDWAFSGHRNHAHYLAKGGDMRRMLAEIYGKDAGCCRGLGGSMHMTDQEVGFIAATPIVGSTIPIGVGAALTAQLRGDRRVVVVFLGDAAIETGVFHESLNFALVKNLPVLFACENNLYSVYSPLSVRQPNGRTLADVARGHGATASLVDGNDVEAVKAASIVAVEQIRAGQGPVFLELSTYRWREHCGADYDNEIGYRTVDEFEGWLKADPIARHHARLTASGTLDEYALQEMERAIAEEINDAVAFAKAAPYPSPDDVRVPNYA